MTLHILASRGIGRRSGHNCCVVVTGEDPMLSDQQQYRYMTVDDMKSLGDDSLKIDVTRDERGDHLRDSIGELLKININNNNNNNLNVLLNPLHSETVMQNIV